MGQMRFIVENRRFLTFGLLLTMFSSFGQTFFIALFGAEIRAAFDLSHGGFGQVYALATLASGGCLLWLGHKIDNMDLRLYSGLICAGLVAACLLMSAASSVVLLWAAIFALRLTGQGLMSHAAITSMARYFHDRRGMAVSTASLGHAAGEGVFPLMAVALIAAIGWRQTWVAVGLALACVLVPLVLWALRGHGERHRRYLERLAATSGRAATTAAGVVSTAVVTAARQWSRREVLRDRNFYLVMPGVLAPSFIMTGLFFHQVHLVETKGWSLAWFAGGFAVYAATTIASTLLSGALVDRTSALRLMRVFLLPEALALVLLASFDHPYTAMAFMFVGGIGAGASYTVVGAVWAEVYGVAHLGAIKALSTALSVFASALAPAVMGWAIDAGVGMETIFWWCLAYLIVGMALIWPAYRGGAPARAAR